MFKFVTIRNFIRLNIIIMSFKTKIRCTFNIQTLHFQLTKHFDDTTFVMSQQKTALDIKQQTKDSQPYRFRLSSQVQCCKDRAISGSHDLEQRTVAVTKHVFTTMESLLQTKLLLTNCHSFSRWLQLETRQLPLREKMKKWIKIKYKIKSFQDLKTTFF